MTKKRKSRRLVVDACVARAAGDTEHPVSSACRFFLEEVLRICHHTVMTDELNREWKRHQSKFTQKWRAAMTARKKAPCAVAAPKLPIDFSGCADKTKEAIEKDRCLIEAARATDHIIVTLDKAFQEALMAVPDGRKLAKDVTWVDPVTDGAEVLKRL